MKHTIPARVIPAPVHYVKLAAGIAALTLVTGCFEGMKFNVAPPECTVNEKTDCGTAPKAPNPMADEPFFQYE